MLRNFISKHLFEVKKEVSKTQDVTEAQTKPPVTTAGMLQNVPVHAQPAVPLPAVSSLSASDIEDARNHFTELIEKSNQPGLDYFEFVKAVSGMQSMPVEGERYKIAFTGFSSAGLTKDILLSSGKHYIAVVEKELHDFNQSWQINYNGNVEEKLKLIEEKKNEMVRLNQVIADLNKEVSELQVSTTEKQNSLSAMKNSFERAAGEAMLVINGELEKINQYIQ